MSDSEKRVKRIDELCQAHLALAADFWWVHDYDSETFRVSPSVSHSLGYRPDELTTLESWLQIVHHSDWPQAETSAKSAVRTMAPSEMRIRFRTKGGVWRTMLCRMRPMVDEEGVPYAMIGVNREIDDLIKIESEIMDRNEDLAQVASVLSHDFRGPVRHICGCTDRIAEQVDELEDALRNGETLDFTVLVNWTKMAKQSSQRLGRMIEHVLQYSRASTKGINPDNIDAGEIVTDILRDYADKISERNATVKVSLMPMVYYDPTMLYLVLANLISNAVKFSKKDDPSPVVHVDGRKTVGEWAAISVRDNGIGFPGSQREKILEMGFRLHHESDYAGFGYGLAIVKKILHRCGGELGVRSKLDEGSEFVLKLPAGKLVR